MERRGAPRALGREAHAFVDVLDLAFILRRCGEIECAVMIDRPFYPTDSPARAYFDRAALSAPAARELGYA